MSTTQARIEKLIQLQMKQGLSAQEQQELLNYMQDPLLASYIRNLLDQTFQQEPGLESLSNDQETRILNHILGDEPVKIKPLFPWLRITAEQEKTPVRKIWHWVASIAAVGLVIGFSYWAFQQSSGVRSVDDQQLVHQEIDVPKITNKAIAILPNGEEVVLNNTGLNNLDEGNISTLSATKEQFITLKTPRGSQVNFVLPDGSRVWLNAETSLTYPTTFGKVSRKVQLDGEAYFEIVKQERSHKAVPFIVDAGKQQIKVLGTKFNVNNYSGEASSKTTLVEGAVEVTAADQVSLLRPNQQFVQSASQSNIVHVDALDYVDWKEGIINLSKQDFPAIAKLIERNFDVKFVGDNLPRGYELDGELTTTVNIDELLKGLGATMGVKFVRDGQQIRLAKK